MGAVPSPFDCYQVLRGVKTLPVRMQRHVESATELAGRLERARGVRRVHYPGLESHPQFALARKQMKGGGGMISVELDGGLDESRRFLSELGIGDSLVRLSVGIEHVEDLWEDLERGLFAAGGGK
jgi:cystathionine beta-lyase/cystathionine gamma-synthase